MFTPSGAWGTILKDESFFKQLLKKSIIFKSLKFRIFIIVLSVGIIPAFIMRLLLIKSYETRAVNQRITDVTNQCTILCSRLEEAGYMDDTSDVRINDELTQLSNLYDGRILIINDNFRVIKDTYERSEGRTIVSKEVIACLNGSSNMSNRNKTYNYVEVTVPVTSQDGDILGAMVASAATDYIDVNKANLNQRAWVIEITVATFVLVIAYALSSTLLQPFDKVLGAINSAKEGYGADLKRVDVPDYTETREIMDAFYLLLGQINEADTAKEEFVANVSHELKTPLASMKVLSDSIRNEENVPVEMYREFMNDIAEEVDRENQIITDLLSLVKLDKQAAVLNVEQTDLGELLEGIVKRLEPIAAERGIELALKKDSVVMADVDSIKLSQALMNIIENAIKYNKNFGWVKITLDSDIQFAQITVSDSGIGIPEDSLNRIFDRFYRADKSHSKEIGGNGLGLAITRSTILLHKGSVRVSSIEGEGSTFTVRLPLIYEK
ncbi:MAG: HAMP domain-containing histidine kinase [Lachnospiraceae bacterium]|nr:HAMP domain-containing histidine kinase [Lachnospiraceae bacterium]